MNRFILSWLLTFFSVFFISPISSEEANDVGIQAVASLLYHVNSEIEDKKEIKFADGEIENLWTKAVQLDSSLIYAKEDYWFWRQQPNDQTKPYLQYCAEALKVLWIEKNSLGIDPIELNANGIFQHCYSVNHLENNHLINDKIRKEIVPHLLPSNLPIATSVDQIFNNFRAIFNTDLLRQAGFKILHKQPRSYIIVANHPAVPGFLFKLYLDTELRQKKNVPGWKWFVRRCEGAKSVRNIIAKKHIKNFTVPTKYIYVLPSSTAPAAIPGIDPKPAVLIVQDMNLVEKELNLAVWKNFVSPEVLDELYVIISRANGSSYRPDNIPFTHSGKFAFIDTEYPNCDPDFASIRSYLSTEMCAYWDQLVKKGGP